MPYCLDPGIVGGRVKNIENFFRVGAFQISTKYFFIDTGIDIGVSMQFFKFIQSGKPQTLFVMFRANLEYPDLQA